MKTLREIVPLNEDSPFDVKKWHIWRYRMPSLSKWAGASDIKRRIKSANLPGTNISLNKIQKYTSPNRIKLNVYNKLGIYGSSQNKEGGMKPVPKLLHKIGVPYGPEFRTKMRQLGHGKLWRSILGMGHTSGQPLNFPKLHATEPKAKRVSNPQGFSKRQAFKPPKQAKDVTKL